MFTFLIGAAIKSTAVLAAAWLLTIFLRKHSAATRHLVWTAAFASLLLLPLFSIALPSYRMPATGVFASGAAVFQISASAPTDIAASPRSVHGTQSSPAPARRSRIDWPLFLTMLCAAGAGAGILRMIAGWLRMLRVRRRAAPFAVPELPALEQTLGINRPVTILELPNGSMPLTFGLLHPVIFMPSDAADWSDERRRMVLLHELAHVQRRDALTHLAVRAVYSLYWWNPLALAAWRQFLKERERAADDLVLNAGARASDYATHLLDIARSMQSSPAAAWAGVAMARPSQLEGRLLAILDENKDRTAPRRNTAWLAGALALLLIAPLAALQAPDSAAAQTPADVEATIRSARSQRNFDLLDKAATAAMDRRQFDTARELLDASLVVRGDVNGAQSVEYGTGLIHLADLEMRQGNSAAATTAYEKAATLLGSQKAAAPALIHLGIAALANHDSARALQYFGQAKLADPAKAGAATMWTAIVAQRDGNVEEATSLYKQALSLEKPDSPEAATILELQAKLLRQQGREAEANEAAAQAMSLRKAAGVHLTHGANVYKIGNGVASPKLLQKVEPQYTDEARAAAYQGTVVVSTEIGTDGLAHNMSIVRGLGLGLNENAIDAINQWKFQPGTKEGQPVTVQAQIEINFRLM